MGIAVFVSEMVVTQVSESLVTVKSPSWPPVTVKSAAGGVIVNPLLLAVVQPSGPLHTISGADRVTYPAGARWV